MWLSFSFASFVSAVVHHVIITSVVWSERSKQLFNGKCKWTEFSSGRSVPIYSQSAILIDSHTLVLFFFIRFFGSKWNPLCWNFTPANPMRATWIKKPEVASHFPRCRRSWWCSLGQFQSASLAALEPFALTSVCCFFLPCFCRHIFAFSVREYVLKIEFKATQYGDLLAPITMLIHHSDSEFMIKE